MPPPGLSTLPLELTLRITSQLSQRELAQCALVNKHWHALCTPVLWRVINISDPVTFHRFKPEEMQQALAKNARHVRELETCYIGVIRWIVERRNLDAQESSTAVLADEMSLLFSLCKNLTRFSLGDSSGSVKIQDPVLPQSTLTAGSHQLVGFGQAALSTGPPAANFGTFANSEGWSTGAPLRRHMNDEEEELVIHLIRSNPHLRTLSMRPLLNNMPAFLSSLSEAHLPNLQDLVIYPHFGLYPTPTNASLVPAHTLKRLFEDLAETIRSIDVGFHVDKTLASDADQGGSCRSHSHLEKLSIRMDLSDMEEYVLLRFLQSCGTNLRLIHMKEYVHLVNEELFQVVNRFSLTKELKFGFLGSLSDHTLARIVSRSHAWRLIDLRWSTCAGLTEAAVADHCQELEELYTGENTSRMSSPALHRILCRATKLLKLHANEDCDEGAPQNSQLQAMDVVSSPWVCRSLQIFRADIVGIPRPDVEFQHDGEPVQGALHTGTVEDSHDLQRRILGQLGALTDLEELGLGAFAIDIGDETAWEDDEEAGGMRYLDSNFQLTCLEMSLASGLEFLSGLKKLKVLDVTRMAHRIGVPELEWMQTNWPSLEKVDGLFNDFYPALVPGVCDWLFEHRPVWGTEYLQQGFCYNETRTRGGFFIGQ